MRNRSGHHSNWYFTFNYALSPRGSWMCSEKLTQLCKSLFMSRACERRWLFIWFSTGADAKLCRWPINTPVIHRAALNIKATRMKSATKPHADNNNLTQECRPSVFTATLVHLHRPARFEQRKNPNLIFFTKKIRRTSDHQFKIYVLNSAALSWWRFHLGARPIFWISLKMLF